MRVENEEIINIIERVSRIKFRRGLRNRGGREERKKKHARCGRTEDVIQRDTEAESNIPRQCNSTMYDVMNERSP